LKYAQVVVETTGATIATYTYGNQLISQTRTGDGTHFYLTDGHLSTRQLTTTAGLVSDTYTYDAFGLALASSGTTQNVYLYTGEQFDLNMGFYYLRARYYNQGTGRFIRTDPLEGNIFDPVSLHRYLYANGDPVNKVDPSGEIVLESLAVLGFIAAIVGIYTAVSVKIKLKAEVFDGTRNFRVRFCNGFQAGIGFGGGYQAAIIAEEGANPRAARYSLWFRGFTAGLGITTASTTAFPSRVKTTVEGFYGYGYFKTAGLFYFFGGSKMILPEGTEIADQFMKWNPPPIGTQSFLNVGIFRVEWDLEESDRGYATDTRLYCTKQYSSFGQ
jgi:RHS repeat-associated protein